MTYTEAANKLRNGRTIDEIIPSLSGLDFFYLIQDGEYDGTLHYMDRTVRVSLIPCEPVGSGVFTIDNKTCPTATIAIELLNRLIREMIEGMGRFFFIIDEEYFKLHIEVTRIFF